MTKRIIFIILFILPSILFAQSIIYGTTLDSASGKVLTLTTITNLNKGKSVVSSYAGRFSIMAELGNLLVATYSGYDFDTIRVTPEMLNDTIMVRMNPLINELPNAVVTAKGDYSGYQLDSLRRRMEHADLLNKANIPAIGGPVPGSGFGVSFSLDRFSKREKNKRKAKEIFEMIEDESYINYRFSDALVAKYTGLENDGLIEFMNLYRPTYDWLRDHQVEEDVVDYINKKLKAYRKVPGNKLKGS